MHMFHVRGYQYADTGEYTGRTSSLSSVQRLLLSVHVLPGLTYELQE